MSLKFNWPEFDADFQESARRQLELALNKGPQRPAHICDDILVKELHMGTVVGGGGRCQVGCRSDDC